MNLKRPSMFLYGFQVTENNRSLDFRAVDDENPRMATLRIGYYSLSSLMREVARALKEADPLRDYALTADRTVSDGLENRVSISTTGGHFEILGASGIRSATSCLPLLGFEKEDYTGETTYTGIKTAGTSLVTERSGYNYAGPERLRKVFGSVNISGSGLKEAIVHDVQKFFRVNFRFEPEAKLNDWVSLMTWLIQQRSIEFTPSIDSPSVVYEATLESTEVSSTGTEFELVDESDISPGLFSTGNMTFRVRE